VLLLVSVVPFAVQATNSPLNDAQLRAFVAALTIPDPNFPGRVIVRPEIEALSWNVNNDPEHRWTRSHQERIATATTTVPHTFIPVLQAYQVIANHSFDRTPISLHADETVRGAFGMPPSLNAEIRHRIYVLYPELENDSTLFWLLGGGVLGTGTTGQSQALGTGGTFHDGGLRSQGRANTRLVNKTDSDFGGVFAGGISNNNMDSTWFAAGSRNLDTAGRALVGVRVEMSVLELYRSFATIEALPNGNANRRYQLNVRLVNFPGRRQNLTNVHYTWIINGYTGTNAANVNTTAAWNNAFTVTSDMPFNMANGRQRLVDYRNATMVLDGGNWRPLMLNDIRVMSHAQLITLRATIDSARTNMTTAQMGANHNEILTHFGLISMAESLALRNLVNTAILAFESNLISYANFFHSLDPAALGVIPDVQTAVFLNNEAVQANNNAFDPRASFGLQGFGFTLDELFDLYFDAFIHHNMMLAASQDTSAQGIELWMNVQLMAANSNPPFIIDIAQQAAWLDNLNRVIQRWDIWNMRDHMVELLAASENYSEGRNPNLDPDWQPNPDNPLDPGGIFGDSNYTHPLWRIELWEQTIRGDQAWIAVKNQLGHGHFVDAIIGNATLNAYDDRLSALHREIDFREALGFSENTWYSYRDFFMPLMAARPFHDWSPQRVMQTLNDNTPHPNAPRPAYRGVLANRDAYNALSAQAAAYFGSTAPGTPWYEIYGGGFGEQIDVLVDSLNDAIAITLALRTRDAMNIINGLADADFIDAQSIIPELQLAHPDTGQLINVFSWSTMDTLNRLIAGLGIDHSATVAIPGADPYLFLANQNRLGQVQLDDYANEIALRHYRFLRNQLHTLHQQFLNNPHEFFRTTVLETPRRAARPDDIRPYHNYNWPQYINDPGKQGLYDIVDRLDSLLTNDVSPLIAGLVDFGFNFPEEFLGISLHQSPLNLGVLFDDMLYSVVYSDATLNMLIQLVFPMILDMLEDLWATMIIPMNGRNRVPVDPIPAGFPLGTVTVRNLDLRFHSLWRILNDDPHNNRSAARLRVYPDLLSRSINATQFPQAHSQLQRGSNLGNGTGLGGNASSRFNVSLDGPMMYPTNAWSPIGSPHLYDSEGNLNLYWGIDSLSGHVREERFRLALSQVMDGVWPLLEILLLNRDRLFDQNGEAVFVHGGTANAWVPGGFGLEGHGTVDIDIDGIAGYQQLLLPIFELLLGENITGTDPNRPAQLGQNLLRTTAQLNAITTPAQLVSAIFDPINEVIFRLSSQPISYLINLLPNLAYAFSTHRIERLFDGLAANANLSIHDNSAPGPDRTVIRANHWVTLGMYVNITNMVVGNLNEALPFEPISMDISDMLFEFIDINLLRDPLTIVDMLTANSELYLPPINLARLATYGTLLSSGVGGTGLATARPAGNVRHYIRANQADVVNFIFSWILGSGMLDNVVPDFVEMSGTTSEMIAAIAQLAQPIYYTVFPVEFSEPIWGEPSWPSWWGDAGETQAQMDAQFIVENADIIINLLWAMLHDDQTLSDGLIEVVRSFANSSGGDIMDALVRMVHALVYGMSEMIELISPLINTLVLVDGQPLDLLNLFDQLMVFEPQETITIEAVIEEFARLLSTLAPVLDFLLAGADLELVDIGDQTGLFKIMGYYGYEHGFMPMLMAFAAPLGLEHLVVTPAEFAQLANSQQRIEAILDPLREIFVEVGKSPFAAVLQLIPNIIYFVTEPDVGIDSPFQQALDNLLHPLYVVLDTLRPFVDILGAIEAFAFENELPAGLSIESRGVRVCAVNLLTFALNNLLLDTDVSDQLNNLDLRGLLLGQLHPTDNFVVSEPAAVFFALLGQLGLLEMVETMGFAGLTRLIQHARFPERARIDYSLAPSAAAPPALPGWLQPVHVDFLVDNVDAVIAWAWDAFLNEPGTRAALSDMLGGLPIKLGDSLPDTVSRIWSNEQFVAENLQTLAEMIYSARETLLTIEIPNLAGLLGDENAAPNEMNVIDLLAELFFIHDAQRSTDDVVPLCLDTMLFNNVMLFLADPSDFPIDCEDSFMEVATWLFGGVMPLLRIFLAESNALFIRPLDDQGEIIITPTNPDVTADGAFLRVFGYAGYQTALLPLLLAFGADIPGFVNELVPYAQFRQASESEQLEALMRPILFLLNTLAANPVDTLLRIVPNIAFFVSDEGHGTSLLNQAIEQLLWPVLVLVEAAEIDAFDDLVNELMAQLRIGEMLNTLLSEWGIALEGLIVGQIVPFTAMQTECLDTFALLAQFNALGDEDSGRYVQTDVAGLLVILLDTLGAFEMLEDFAGLLNLLNAPGRERIPLAGLVDYTYGPQAAAPVHQAISEEYIDFILSNVDGLVNWLWSSVVYGGEVLDAALEMLPDAVAEVLAGIVVENTLAATIDGALGGLLYTQENFDLIAELLIGVGETLVNQELIVGITLGTLLYQTVSIGGQALDLAAQLAQMQAMNPVITGQASFLAALNALLAPLMMPLLQVFLVEQDILLIMADGVNNGQGLGVIDGFDGYRTGLMPILLALVGGLTDDPAEAGILGYAAFAAAPPEEQLAALVAPIFFVLESLIEAPMDTLLNLLPNLAYFAAGENSLLSQALRNLLHPITALLELLPETPEFDIESLFAFDVDSLLAGSGLVLADLVTGTVTPFAAPWNVYGLNHFTAFVTVNQAQLVLSLIESTGLLDGIEPGDLEAILRLLNLPGRTPSQAQRIDYALAPTPVTVDMSQWPWLEEMHVEFLVDNLDGVLNWAWTALFANNPDAQAMLYDDFGIMLGNSVEETLQNLLGDHLYTAENFRMIAGVILELAQGLLGFDVLGLSLVELIADLVEIDGEPLDLAAMLARFEETVPAVSDAASFREALIWLLEPFGPVLRILLAQGDLAMFVHEDVNNGEGLVRLFGSNGYETALLPLLLALGANVPGFIDMLVPYQVFRNADDSAMVAAIIDPLLFVLQALVSNPVNTVVQVLPNLAMFMAGGENSLSQQAVNNLLYPLQPILAIPMVAEMLDDGIDVSNILGMFDIDGLLSELGLSLAALVIGDVVLLSETTRPEFAALGLNDCAMFLDVNAGMLVVALLDTLSAFDMLEDFASLINLLNTPGRVRTQLRPPHYPQIDVCTRALYSCVLWTRACARTLANQLPRLLDNIAPVLFGDTLGGWLYGLLGDNLFTQENFDMIVGLLRDAVETLDLSVEIVPNRTLSDLIGNAVLVGGQPLNLAAALAHIESFPGAQVTNSASFLNGLIGLLEPLGPVFGWLLFGEDVQLLGGVAQLNNGQGLFNVFGYEGYRFGLVPILEALLMPLQAQNQIARPNTLAQASDRERIEAILNPLIYLMDRLVSDPWDTLLTILPNVAYFVSSGLLQESLDNMLYAVTSVVDAMSAEPLLELDAVALINGMLDELPFNNIDFGILHRLIVGTPSAYTSRSGWQGFFVAIASDNDRADLTTAILRELLNLIQNDQQNRLFVIDAIADALTSNNFTRTLMRWGLQFTLWNYRIWGSVGQNNMLRHLTIFVRFLNIFWRPIAWFL